MICIQSMNSNDTKHSFRIIFNSKSAKTIKPFLNIFIGRSNTNHNQTMCGNVF